MCPGSTQYTAGTFLATRVSGAGSPLGGDNGHFYCAQWSHLLVMQSVSKLIAEGERTTHLVDWVNIVCIHEFSISEFIPDLILN